MTPPLVILGLAGTALGLLDRIRKAIPLPWLLTGVMAVTLLLGQCSAGRRVAEANERRDSLATVALEARAAELGWETSFARETERGQTLARWLQDSRDSTALLQDEVAELAREVETLGGELRVVAEMYARAVGQIEAHDAVLHTSAEGPDSITGHVDDGLLSADVTATLEPPTVAIPRYSVELALALGWIEAPDGRALVTARASDPRVELRFGETYYDPPAPIQVCTFGQRLEAGAWGGGIALGIRELLATLAGGGS